MGQPHRVGIIGVGFISGQYLTTLASQSSVRIVAVADLNAERAAEVAAGMEGARALTVAELLADAEVETVLNLTIPGAHAEIALAALDAGKNVYGEKPLAVTLDDGRRIMERADAVGRQVGSAPDTVLGTGIQTARKAIDDGLIGRPLAAVATWVAPGHERWHPNPDFYYQPGGGPVLDMGPYYVHSLLQLLGPVTAVVGLSSRSRDERAIGSGPREGEVFPVAVQTHLAGALQHASGAISTVTVSFDAVRTTAAPIEIHGETGSLSVPDPNNFDGDTAIFRLGAEEWETLPTSAGYVDSGRGIGLVDLAAGHGRASGAIGLHALEIMTGLLAAAESGTRVEIASTFAMPELVPLTPAEAWRA